MIMHYNDQAKNIYLYINKGFLDVHGVQVALQHMLRRNRSIPWTRLFQQDVAFTLTSVIPLYHNTITHAAKASCTCACFVINEQSLLLNKKKELTILGISDAVYIMFPCVLHFLVLHAHTPEIAFIYLNIKRSVSFHLHPQVYKTICSDFIDDYLQ